MAEAPAEVSKLDRDKIRNEVARMRTRNVGVLAEVFKARAQDCQNEETANNYRWFADQLEFSGPSTDLLRELILRTIIEPVHEKDRRTQVLRAAVGWDTQAKTFEGLMPEFLEVIYLLSPRDYVIEEALREFPANLTGKILDIGTGTGLLLELLRVSDVTAPMSGIEPAGNLAEFTQRRLSAAYDKIEITRQKLQHFHVPEAHFEAVLCHMVLHHVSDNDGEFRSCLDKIFHMLSEGGWFIYTDKLFGETGIEQPLEFEVPGKVLSLTSGQDIVFESAGIPTIRPFRPHPGHIPETPRRWPVVAEQLAQAGFLIERIRPLNTHTVLFVCRKPHTQKWRDFGANTLHCYPHFLTLVNVMKWCGGDHAPYQFTYDVLRSLYEDITGEKCPKKHTAAKFVKGIAYLSWEKAGRLFLVRRAVPEGFHMLSYSHVHEGWGAVGRMLEEFEDDPHRYKDWGYSYLTAKDVQRTLPFLGDIEHLGYKAALAVPVYAEVGLELRGAFLIFLEKVEYLPLRTNTAIRESLAAVWKSLSSAMNEALVAQDTALKAQNQATELRQKWMKEVEKPGLNKPVIAELRLQLSSQDKETSLDGQTERICSRIQAMLSGADCYSFVESFDSRECKACLLVAARHGLVFEDIRDKILTAIGYAAGHPLIAIQYTCERWIPHS